MDTVPTRGFSTLPGVPPVWGYPPMENTFFFTELWGWFFLLFALALLIRGPKRLLTDLTELVSSRASTIIVGYTVMLLGLISILQYNAWNRGILEACISLFGWLMLLKGMVFLMFPSCLEQKMKFFVRYPMLLTGALIFAIILGVYLLAISYNLLPY